MRRKQIACASSHSAVVTDKGTVYVWGNYRKLVSSEQDEPSSVSAVEEPCLSYVEAKRKAPRLSGEVQALENAKPCSASCEDRAVVLMTWSGALEEWRNGQKKILWSVEPFHHSNLWIPKATFIASGASHSLVIDDGGRLWTWGSNAHGELGQGDMHDRAVPTLVAALDKIAVVRAAGGGKHSLCCSQDGDVYSFGYNEKGQLGTGNNIGQPAPVLLTSLQKTIKDVVCGASHSAVLADDGTLYLFGAGNYGRCGHGYDGDVNYPLENETLARIGRVAMCSLGEVHSACVMESGHLYVWGSGMYNKLGLGDDCENKLFPTEVKSGALGLFSQVACGQSHTVAVLKSGHVVSWGLPSSTNRLGRSLSSDATRPGFVEGIAKDDYVTRSLVTDGTLSSVTTSGPSAKNAPPPVVSRAHMVKQIAAGGFHSLILTNAGTVYSFGSNNYGQCGIEYMDAPASEMDEPQDTWFVKTPHRVNVLDGTIGQKVSFIACGITHSLVITVRGSLYTFGNGSHHQLGLGTLGTKAVPTLVSSLGATRVEFAAGGELHSACVTREGSLYTWGSSDSGKLGLGKSVEPFVKTPTLTHIPLELGDQVSSVSCAAGHTLIVTKRGKLFACGSGFYGRLGTGRTRNEYEPVEITFETANAEGETIVQASAGDLHSACITRNGDLYVWGIGDARLGLGETVDKLLPVKNPKCVAGGPCTRVVAAESHTLVMTADGTVWSFGRNAFGKLGVGSDPRDCSSPERIKPEIMHLGVSPESSLQRDVRAISSRTNHCLALASDGQVYCWGAAGQGRLGLSSISGLNEIASPRRLDDPEAAGTGEFDDDTDHAPVSESVMEVCIERIEAFKAAVACMTSQGGDRTMIGNALSWRDIKIPIGAIQYFLKARNRPNFSDNALKHQLKACLDWEAINLRSLREFSQHHGELSNQEMTIAFAVEHVSSAVARPTFASVGRTPQGLVKGVTASILSTAAVGSSHRNWMQSTHTENRHDGEDNVSPNDVFLTQHLKASLPFLEQVLSLLLINPGLMFALYQRLVLSKSPIIGDGVSVRWSDLFVGLCRDLYSFNDIHSSRLFHRLAITIAVNEIDNAKSFPLYTADFQRRSMFYRLFELLLVKQPKLSTEIKTRLRAEFTPMKKSASIDFTSEGFRRSMALWEAHGRDSIGDHFVVDRAVKSLSEMGVRIFGVFENTVLRVIFQEYPVITKLCFDFYALLVGRFSPGSGSGNGVSRPEDHSLIALFIARLLFHALFEPVLKDPSRYGLDDPVDASDEFPDVVTREALVKFLVHVLSLSPYSRSVVSSNAQGVSSAAFEASVAVYQNTIRSSLGLKARQELDAKMVEAQSDVFKQQQFEALIDELRQKYIQNQPRASSGSNVESEQSKTAPRFTGLAGSFLQASFEALEDIFRPLREQSVKLMQQDLRRATALYADVDLIDFEELSTVEMAQVMRKALSANLLIDLAREHLRFPRMNHQARTDPLRQDLCHILTIYPTRRTLEFVKYVVSPPSESNGINGSHDAAPAAVPQEGASISENPNRSSKTPEDAAIFSSQGEWQVLQTLVKEYESEYGESIRLKNFELRVHELDDTWGIALSLDARKLELGSERRSITKMITSQSEAVERLHDLTRLDSLTASPIPAQLVKDRDLRADVLGFESIAASINSESLALRDTLCALDRLSIDATDPEYFHTQVDAEANKSDAPEVFKRWRDRLPGGEDLVRLFNQMLGDVEMREHAVALLSSLCRAHESLAQEIAAAMKEVESISKAMVAYANVLRDKDMSQNRRQVEEIARRKGKAYRLTNLDIIRALQVRSLTAPVTHTKPSLFLRVFPCFQIFTEAPDDRVQVLAQKHLFSAHQLVRGALVTLRYQQLHEREIIIEIPRKPFGVLHESGEACLSMADAVARGRALQEDCSLGDEYLSKNWRSISRKLVFTFALTDQGRFTITVVFNAVCVIAFVEDHISSLITRSRSFSLDWHPYEHFPVKFRVHRLMGLVQEMTLQAFI